jgi:hypothetical protein
MTNVLTKIHKFKNLFTVISLMVSSVTYSADSSQIAEILLKSLIPSLVISPLKFTTAKLSVGGFINFAGQSTGDYKKDVERGESGYGALLAYEFPTFEAEAFSKKLVFHKNTELSSVEEVRVIVLK